MKKKIILWATFTALVGLILSVLYVFNILTFAVFETLGFEFLQDTRIKFQSTSKDSFLRMLREDSPKGKLIFREKNSMGMLDLETREVKRTWLLPETYQTIQYRISQDKRFLTFVMPPEKNVTSMGDMRMILNLQSMVQNSVDVKEAYTYNESATYGLEGKKARTEFIPEANPFTGGTSNHWYFSNSDNQGQIQLLNYDGEKNKATVIPLSTDRYDFIKNRVYVDPPCQWLYLVATIKHQFRVDEQDVYPNEILKIRLSDMQAQPLKINSNRVHVQSLAFIPGDADRVWVYGLNTFYLVNLKSGQLEDTHIIPSDSRGDSHYFDENFVVDSEGMITCMKDIGSGVFGGLRLARVFQFNPQTRQLKYLLTLHAGGDLQWVP